MIMYERNAIILERYFNQKFGYDMKNNIKTNFKDYCELVGYLENYRDISDEEETIIQEYDMIANKIRDVQKKQELLNKKNNKYQEERADIFQNIDENAKAIQKKFDQINDNIQKTNEEIKENAQSFIEVVNEFNEKSIVRTSSGRERRTVEEKYNKKLNETLDNYKNIDIELEKKAKEFIDIETTNIEQELKEKMRKNGEKEKIPFNLDVITKAITLSVDIQKRETDILANVYEKTNKLFAEIKNNSTKGEKHKKIIKDSKSKLEFIGALKEYLVQFLDNERLTAVNGEDEHNKLMEEACKNIEEDLIQINNLYTLLLKEISKKITKKSYSELYNLEYLKKLEKKADEFDAEIKKLHLPVTIINPNYWRIEGMRKIYDIFYKCVTENYGRDLSEYIKVEKDTDIDNDIDNEEEIEDFEETKNKTKKAKGREINDISKDKEKKNDTKTEIDKKIDMILGIDEGNTEESYEEDEEDYEDWDDDDYNEDEEEFENEDFDEEDLEEDEYDDDDDEYEEDEDWDDEDENWDENEKDIDNEEDLDSYIWGNEPQEDDDNEDEEDEDWNEDWDKDEEDSQDLYQEKNSNKKRDITSKIKNIEEYKKQEYSEAWENEFVNIKKKGDEKKKKGFFDKFKK